MNEMDKMLELRTEFNVMLSRIGAIRHSPELPEFRKRYPALNMALVLSESALEMAVICAYMVANPDLQ